MGYEIKLILGKASALVSDEWKLSTKRYSDDSGFKLEEDEKGNIITTGRKEHWFHVMATVDLCKLDYGSPLSALCSNSHKTAKENIGDTIHFYYSDDGNTQIKEDRYGAAMWPIPLKDLLRIAKTNPDAKTYRRLKWAIALAKSMADDPEELSALAFGH